MGLGVFKKAIGGVFNAIPGGRSVAKIASFNPIFPGFTGDASNAANRGQRNLEKGALAVEQNAQIQADAEKAKAIAAESVRLQEEKERKRTLFAGEALGAASERKTLLGL
jgi:hypothetical protein